MLFNCGPNTERVVAGSRNGFLWQAFVGSGVEEFEFVKESQQVQVNGRTFTGPLNVVRKATLSEISFVVLGADSRTSARQPAHLRSPEPVRVPCPTAHQRRGTAPSTLPNYNRVPTPSLAEVPESNEPVRADRSTCHADRTVEQQDSPRL